MNLTEDQQARFWGKVNKTNGCWLWTASVGNHGYGQFGVNRADVRLAHRVSYELMVGPIPRGLTIDHLCGVLRCVNPAHLEVVTRSTNAKRQHAEGRCRCHGRPQDVRDLIGGAA